MSDGKVGLASTADDALEALRVEADLGHRVAIPEKDGNDFAEALPQLRIRIDIALAVGQAETGQYLIEHFLHLVAEVAIRTAEELEGYSHSMVPGGLLVMS